MSYAIAKEQPALAGVVFIVGTIGTRGIRKEVQARLIAMAGDRIKALEKDVFAKPGEDDDER